LANFLAHAVGMILVVWVVQDGGDPPADLSDRVFAEPSGGQCRGTHADAAGVAWLAGVEGDEVLVDGDPRAAEGVLGELPWVP
jgi:hypothetical protein